MEKLFCWAVKACCQLHFALNKRSLGSAARGTTKGTARGFLRSCDLGRKRHSKGRQRVCRAGGHTCQASILSCLPQRVRPSVCLAAERGDHMHPACPLPPSPVPPRCTAPANAPSRGTFCRRASSSPCQGSLLPLLPNKVWGLCFYTKN